MEEVVAAGNLVETALGASNEFVRNAELLAKLVQRSGEELRDAFADLVLSRDLGEEARSVAEVFVAWREVGEAQIGLAARLLEVSKQLRGAAQKAQGERQQRLAEAGRLQQSLADAEAEAGAPARRGWFTWLRDEEEEASAPAGAAQQKLEGQRAATAACMEQLALQLAGTRQRGGAALGEAVGDLRRHAKAVGEKVSLLRPSWRGQASRGGGGGGAAASGTTPPTGKAKKVEGLIRTLSTAEGRQQARDAEEAREATQTVAVDEIAVMLAPPAQVVGTDEWRIRGVYEHQVLKAGLRQLDDQWPVEALQEFPRGLFRERLLSELLSGKIRLQSVPTSDVSAAQRDVKRLSLRQLLRLRVLHLDFTPSGCGADTVTAVGGTHEAFLTTLDSLLFQHLGRKATAGLEKKPTAADEHRVGREAVLLVAAAAAVSASPWWCWWLRAEQRCFFHGTRFACRDAFPGAEEGALEVTDLSKADRNDPTGRLRWMDWRVDLVRDEAKLAEAPRGGDAVEGGADGGTISTTSSTADTKSDGGAVGASLSSAAGAATASMVSPEVLRDLRGSLRKTGGPGSPSRAAA